MIEETKLLIHSTTAKAALKFISEAWVLRKGTTKNGSISNEISKTSTRIY